MYFWKYILAKKAGLSQQKCNMALYGLPVLPIAEAFEKTVTGNPISVTDALAQDALSLQVAFEPTQDGTPSIDSEPTTEPYLSKLIPRGNKEYYSLVGATVAWNTNDFSVENYGAYWEKVNSYTLKCILQTTSNTYPRPGKKLMLNHSYLIKIENNTSVNINLWYDDAYSARATVNSNSSKYYIYKRTTGPDNGYPLYQIPSGVQVGEEIKTNIVDLTLMFANNPAIADYAYTLEQSEAGSGIAWLKSQGFFTKDYYPYNAGELISVKTSGHKVGSTTYPLSDTELRGLFKLDVSNKLYCEGDLYPPSGSATRNYEYRAYQSGDESLADAITDGTHTVVKLATPTTESLTPYTSPIDVEAGGTEEFIDNRAVPIPVGNETYYASEYAVHGKASVTVSHGATQDDPNPTEYEVEFTSQGTVYGGTVDIVTGELTVNCKHFTFNELAYYGTYGAYNAPLYYVEIPDYNTEPVKNMSKSTYLGTLLSNFFTKISTESSSAMQNNEMRTQDSQPSENPSRFYMRIDGINPISASSPLQVVAELVTPKTYTLTPEQVTMLLGNNYLETEDGTITITYMAGK